MLVIHVDNHFSDEFIPPCHVSYFFNNDGRKLTAGYICHNFLHFQGLNFVFSSFGDIFISELHIERQKWLFTQLCNFNLYYIFSYSLYF